MLSGEKSDMAPKDNWDKFDIIFKALVLGIIPIVIKFGADNIAQSVERGKIVQSQIDNLTTKKDSPDKMI